MISLLALGMIAVTSAPIELNHILKTVSGDAYGWSTPVSSELAITVKHLSENPGRLYWMSKLDQGDMTVVLSKTNRDLSLLRSEKTFYNWLRFSKTKPEPLDWVYYKCYIDFDHEMKVRGSVLGYDKEGDLLIEGYVQPGCSGSGVLNQNGELLGVVSAMQRLARDASLVMVMIPVDGLKW